jgi:erythromycin esterase
LAKDATVIGIGESTHVTKLYNTSRQRLMRFLIHEMGYKAIVDEGDILVAEKLDAYINYRTDSIELYNKNKSEDDKVHIYGAEVRGFYAIIQKLKSFSLSNNINPFLEKLTGNVGAGFKNLTRVDFAEIKKLADKWSAECNDPLCSYYLSLLNQQINFAFRQRFGSNDFNVRDNYMFENIRLVVSKTPGNKVIVLNHNGHLQKTKLLPNTSLGYLLNNFYGSKYFLIGTDFNKGDVTVYDPKTGGNKNLFFEDVDDKKAIEFYLKQCKYPNFLLPIRAASINAVTASLINNKTKMTRFISAYGIINTDMVRISDNYDLIVFFNDTNETEM